MNKLNFNKITTYLNRKESRKVSFNRFPIFVQNNYIMKLSDKNLIQAALNVYARHLRGFKHYRYTENLKRVEELQSKEITVQN